MDFAFTEKENALRTEVQDFIRKEFQPESKWQFRIPTSPSVWGLEGEKWELARAMCRKFGAKGWLSLSWPEKYGGQNSVFLQHILYEELMYTNCPGIDPAGVAFLAPTLIRFGNEEQKKRHLPGIGRGEVSWCELLSEPDGGSDLASLKTTATRDGDYWVINGQKTWNSGAHRADWGFILVRTDPSLARHKGLSYFLLDMKTPGIKVNPIVNIAGEHELNEVFLDNVRVHNDNLVAGLNQGWYVTMETLDFERLLHIYYPAVRAYLEALVQYTQETKKPLNPVLRNRLAQLLAECEMARLTHYRALRMIDKGMKPTYETAMDKIYNTELGQKAAEFGMQVVGHYGNLVEGSKFAVMDGWPSFSYLDAAGFGIMGGTFEINRNIIADRGLGLPR